jgi:hypothetical protein
MREQAEREHQEALDANRRAHEDPFPDEAPDDPVRFTLHAKRARKRDLRRRLFSNPGRDPLSGR